jgi:hypothetical protein
LRSTSLTAGSYHALAHLVRSNEGSVHSVGSPRKLTRHPNVVDYSTPDTQKGKGAKIGATRWIETTRRFNQPKGPCCEKIVLEHCW